MRKSVELYLSHAENRIRICEANALLWGAKGDKEMAQLARSEYYRWVGLAQDQHNEDHF